jgi:NHL repeat/WD40-like Beta Propeller Repeat
MIFHCRHRNQGAGLKTTEHARRHLLRSGGGGGSDARMRSVAVVRPWPARLAALLAVSIATLFIVAVGSASALTTRQLQTQITGTCPAPGNCSAAERIGFAEPEGLTVDSSDRLWVADRPNHAVDRFGPAGAFEAQNTGTGSWGESHVRRLAFSAAVGEVFVADQNECALWGLEAVTATASGKKLTPSSCPLQLAADNSSGATGGDLYVSTGSTVLRLKASDGSADIFTDGPGVGTDELTGPFTEVNSLAVAPDGDFYVAGRNAGGENAVFQFEPSGEFTGTEITEAQGESLGFISALAVDPTNENLLLAAGFTRVLEFGPAGAYLREIRKPAGAGFLGIEGLAVDSTGRLSVSDVSAEPKQVDVFGPLVTLPDVTTGLAEVHSTTSAGLHGEVGPATEPLTECFFEYGPTTAYGQTAECEPDAAALGEGPSFEPVTADIENLIPGAVYHYRLVAANANGTNSESEDREFVTGATIDATSASDVTATTATLETEVNPHGLPTTYSFRYGPTTAYGSQTPMPPAPLGAGTVDVLRSAAIEGLQPATTYHFQVIATNALGTSEGPDRTFTTQPAAFASGLPDDRGWELVSPPNKQGIPLGPISRSGGVIQAAADGSAIAYFGEGSIVAEPAGDRSTDPSEVLSARGASGWSNTDIATPHQDPAGLHPGNPSEYKLFSPDLSLAAVQPFGDTPLSPLATEETPYLRRSDGSYAPLVYPGNVPAGTQFGGGGVRSGVNFITATPDLSHLLLESETSLVEGFEANEAENIYEWNAGALSPVNYVPSGTAALCGGTAPACVAGQPAQVGNSSQQVRNAISTDGSRVFFSTGAELFLRDLSRGETLRLDAAQEVAEPEHAEATFQDASTDGRRVFFTDAARLTPASTAAQFKPDLYMCEITVEAGHLACNLTDLTTNHLNPAEPANVEGTVIGAAADGSSVYFVADGALTAGEGAVTGDCGNEAGQSCNLYHYDTETAETRLVAVLSGADFPDWKAQNGGNLGELTARVSPNGRWLAFMSERPLTGYDNRDAVSGQRDEEVFLYDGQAQSGAGKLICASCNPTGARPQGRRGPPNIPAALVDNPGNWEGRWYAANVPGWTRYYLTKALYQSRYLSDQGRLFFNASDALVPSDTNGTEDLYQYEPPGIGSCSEASPGFAARNDGCVSLISSGTSAEESAFMDASESGNDVFFLTASRLTARDEDKALDLYDARIGGGEAAPVKPVECSGDACQQPAVPPAHPTPGTLLVNGPENIKQCPKGKQLQKGKCVKRKQKSKKHKKGKTSQKNSSSKKKGGGKKQKSKRDNSGHGGHK